VFLYFAFVARESRSIVELIHDDNFTFFVTGSYYVVASKTKKCKESEGTCTARLRGFRRDARPCLGGAIVRRASSRPRIGI